jgi:transcriptional regulator with XRE-family HTH domain
VSEITKISLSDSENANNIAKYLRVLLDERKLSESDVAQAIGLPVMTVRRIISGETTDPRISTLKLIADFFNISIDFLLDDNLSRVPASFMKKNVPHLIPVIDWQTISNIGSINELQLLSWKNWQPITLTEQNSILSDLAFGIESKPSMQPRFPLGTLFIIDPKESPQDGDILLIKIKLSDELSLREVIIDVPKWQLQPIIQGSETFYYDEEKHKIVGVVILTMLNSRKNRIIT